MGAAARGGQGGALLLHRVWWRAARLHGQQLRLPAGAHFDSHKRFLSLETLVAHQIQLLHSAKSMSNHLSVGMVNMTLL